MFLQHHRGESLGLSFLPDSLRGCRRRCALAFTVCVDRIASDCGGAHDPAHLRSLRARWRPCACALWSRPRRVVSRACRLDVRRLSRKRIRACGNCVDVLGLRCGSPAPRRALCRHCTVRQGRSGDISRRCGGSGCVAVSRHAQRDSIACRLGRLRSRHRRVLWRHRAARRGRRRSLGADPLLRLERRGYARHRSDGCARARRIPRPRLRAARVSSVSLSDDVVCGAAALGSAAFTHADHVYDGYALRGSMDRLRARRVCVRVA